MTALIIVFSVLAFFFLIAMLRLGVIAEYSEDGFFLTALAGPVSIKLVPAADKEDGKKKKTKTQKDKTQKRDKSKIKSSQNDKKGGTVKKVLTVLPTILQTLGRFFKHLKIDLLTVRYSITGSDPCDVALTYGYASGALGYLCPILDRNFKIKKWDINVFPCFTDGEETMYIKAKATIAVWELIYIILKLDFKAIFSIL